MADTPMIRVEVWSDLAAAGGSRLAFASPGDVLAASDSRELGGPETLSLTLRRDSAAWREVQERRVVRVVHVAPGAGGVVEEWRITEVGDSRGEDGAEAGTLSAESPLQDWTDADLVARVESDGRVTLDFDLYGLTPAEHLAAVLPFAPAYAAVGEVEVTDPVDVSYPALSPLAALLAVAEAAGAEVEYQRDGDARYLVHLRIARGSDAEEAQLAYAKNLLGLSRTRAVAPMATRVYPTGATEDEFLSTMGGAEWEVSGVAGAVLTLAGGPLRWDEQLDGLYAESLSSGAISRIEATDASGQTITLQSATGFAVGDLVAIRADAEGTELTYVDRPSPYAAYGPKVARLSRPDIPAIDNLLRNPYLDQWAGGLPVGWHTVGTVGLLSEETSALYRRHGSASAHLVVAAAGAGLQSDWVRVTPTAARPYLTGQVALWVVSGAVRLEVDVEDAGGAVITYPLSSEGAAYTSKTGTWVEDLKVYGLDLYAIGGRRVRLRLVAHSDTGADVYLDAAQVVQEADGPAVFWGGRAGCDLWLAALDWLEAHGEPEVRYDVGVVDLQRVDPFAFTFDRLVLGGTVRVRDAVLGLDVTTRISRLERDLLMPGDARVSLASLPQTLSREVAAVPPRRPRPGGAAPGAGVPAEILEVTVTGTATATVRVRANAAAVALWYEASDGAGGWGAKTKIGDGSEGGFAVARPTSGEDLYRVAGEDSGGALGPWREVPVAALQEIPDSATRPDLYAVAFPGASLDTADVHGQVRDSFGTEATLSVWVRKADYDSPDPDDPPDGSVDLSGTPMAFGPSTVFGAAGALLNEIKSHPAEPKTIYLEAVSPDGRSTGRVALPLSSRMAGLVNAVGELEAGSILRWSQFAEKYQPPLLFATEAAMQAATGVEEGRRAVTQDTGTEWVYRSGAWVQEAFPRSEGFYPVLTAGAVRAAYLHADVGDFVDVRAQQAAFDEVYAEALNAIQANVGTLSEIFPNAGIILAGKLQNPAGTRIFNLDATGSQSILKVAGALDVKADGTTTWFGDAPSVLADANAYTDAAVAGSGAGTGNVILRSTTAPSVRPGGAPLVAGDVWLETDNGDLPSSWSGSAWIRTYTKIDGGNITTGTVSANRLHVGVGTAFDSNYDPTTKETPSGAQAKANSALSSAQSYTNTQISAGTNKITRSSSAPASPKVGDLWVDTAHGSQVKTWTGSSWAATETQIDGGRITTGTISAGVVFAGELNGVTGTFAGNVTSGAIISAQQFTAPSAHFTGAIEVDGVIDANLGLTSWRDLSIAPPFGIKMDNSKWRFVVDTTANKNINLTSFGNLLFYFEDVLSGTKNAYALAGNWVSSSDRRMKTDLAPRSGSLARVRAVAPVTFERVASGVPEVGFAAQDVQAVLPEAVFDMGTVDGIPNTLGLSALPLVAELWGAVRELSDRLDQRFPGLLSAAGPSPS